MPSPVERIWEFVRCAASLGASPQARWAILWCLSKNLRVQLKLAAYHPTEVYTLDTVYGPLYFRDNFGDITNLTSVFYHREYRVQALQKPGVILDVGANIGMAAAWFAHHNPGRPIYCFEPLAANAALIGRNCPSAYVERVAVGARRGRVKLRVDEDDVMASNIPCDWKTQEEEFDVISLDEFAETRGLGQVALIKIDVEGMEIEVLRGCRELLHKTEQVVMETHSRSLHDETIGYLRGEFDIEAEQFEGTTGLVFAARRRELRQ